MQLQALCCNGQPLNPDKCGTGDIGLDAGPGPWCCIAVGQALAQQGQAHIDSVHGQTQGIGLSTIDTGKARQAMATDQEHVHGNWGGRFIHLGAGHIGQNDRTTALLNTKFTCDLQGSKRINIELTRTAHQLALTRIHGQCHTGWLSGGAGLDFQPLGHVVDQAAIAGSAVDVQCQGIG